MSAYPDDSAVSPSGVTRKDVLVAVGVVEFIVLLISLALPLTPRKVGPGTNAIGHVFVEDPTYLDHVWVGFLLGNAIVVVLALVCWVWIWWDKRPQNSGAARG